MVKEAEQGKILLFLDEAHSLVGAGGMPGTGDIASQLKPALGRGDIACIAATTDEEYRRWIEPDTALERRFQPIRVQELSCSDTLEVLRALREGYAREQNIEVPDEVLGWTVDFAEQFPRNRHFPDKAVDLFEQCLAYSVARNSSTITVTDTQAVAQRITGMPAGLCDRLQDLKKEMQQRGLLTEDDASRLTSRLEVTCRCLDLRPNRPNAVLFAAGPAAQNAHALAKALSEILYGASDRVVSIDFGAFTEHHDISQMIGAPPGYIGFGGAVPLHRVCQIP